MKLHLGCGKRYLKGYIKVDYPSKNHSVQINRVADIHADILNLKYDKDSIEEIRLHHVFEHFTQPIACVLLNKLELLVKTGWHPSYRST